MFGVIVRTGSCYHEESSLQLEKFKPDLLHRL